GGTSSTLEGIGVTNTSANAVTTIDAGSSLNLKDVTFSGGLLASAGKLNVTGSVASALVGISVTNTNAAITIDSSVRLNLKDTTLAGGTLANSGTVGVIGGANTLIGVNVTNKMAGAALIMVTPGTGESLSDANGNIFSFDALEPGRSDYIILRNGIQYASGAAAVLALVGGTVWAET